MKEKILVTGATGQIGTVLTAALRDQFGENNVLATDIREPETAQGLFARLDVLDKQRIADLIADHRITQIYHLAAILSARGEQNPPLAWEINMSSLFNMLEAARERGLRVFFPSSIAVFGTETPRQQTPQFTTLFPETVYGISKTAGEFWCRYYFRKFGVDVRSIRYPGIISYQSMPGGGTTDYAVEIYHHAVKEKRYQCFLREDTRLPMLYMPDAVRAALELMAAPAESIRVRTSYNLAGMSFSPEEVAAEIRKHIPAFRVSYQPDFRQQIADTWPESVDDSVARRDWGWRPQYDLASTTTDMLEHLSALYRVANISV